MAELATVEIINKFVEMIEVNDKDENGVSLLQLPTSQQNDVNYREELRKPIDKFDWMSFQKMSRQVFIPESERFTHCEHQAFSCPTACDKYFWILLILECNSNYLSAVGMISAQILSVKF